MTEAAVTYESEGAIATITINRPDKLNSINKEVEDQLADAWARFEAGDDRVAILTGAGDKAFSAGKDLKSSAPPNFTRFTPGVGVKLTKPVIAAVEGWCIGGALTLVQMCDLCVVSENTKFVYPEPKVGFAGGLIASLAARIPHKVAMELMLLGEEVSGQRMYDVGFANRIVPKGQVMDEANRLARSLAENAPLVMAMLKEFANFSLPPSPVEHAGFAQRVLQTVFDSEDYQEGFASVREKRKPTFTGR
ncbi:enoyl-CoA hydratase-related protein [Salinisphaera sp. T31B1]|uniref:enoyl-CoA hydratase/isomerase family protein n=1 Tax=Salinisphaera sp. T31B1 TaxID=727963 RepID=UPI0033404735